MATGFAVMPGKRITADKENGYKYCIYETGQRREQLADLEEDPGEMKNLAADPAYAGVLARHRQYLREWVETNHDKLAAAYLIQ